MTRSIEEELVTKEFEANYRLGEAAVMRSIERSVCGCDYGSTSWTTRGEAERIAAMLDLAPGTRLLDIGAGAGWPALFLARMTGCDAVLVDLPLAGLRIAMDRAAADGLGDTCWMVSAEAEALPFPDASFDAICHSDVLCCLQAKRAVLASCRRSIRSGGRMVFTVISVAPDLASADMEDTGPPFAWSETPYTDLLAQTGWHIDQTIDLSATYTESIRRMVNALESHASAVCDLLGAAVLGERLESQRRALGAAEAGILRRHLFATTASASGPGMQA